MVINPVNFFAERYYIFNRNQQKSYKIPFITYKYTIDYELMYTMY